MRGDAQRPQQKKRRIKQKEKYSDELDGVFEKYILYLVICSNHYNRKMLFLRVIIWFIHETRKLATDVAKAQHGCTCHCRLQHMFVLV